MIRRIRKLTEGTVTTIGTAGIVLSVAVSCVVWTMVWVGSVSSIAQNAQAINVNQEARLDRQSAFMLNESNQNHEKLTELVTRTTRIEAMLEIMLKNNEH